MKEPLSRRTSALLTFGIGGILVVAIIAIVALNLGKFLTAIGIQQEPEFHILPVPDDPFHEAALAIERVAGIDVLIMRESEKAASAAIVLPDDMSGEQALNVTQYTLATLAVLASDDVGYLAVACVQEPQEGDPRYPLVVGVACAFEAGYIQECESNNLTGGYLSPDSVWWPGEGR